MRTSARSWLVSIWPSACAPEIAPPVLNVTWSYPLKLFNADRDSLPGLERRPMTFRLADGPTSTIVEKPIVVMSAPLAALARPAVSPPRLSAPLASAGFESILGGPDDRKRRDVAVDVGVDVRVDIVGGGRAGPGKEADGVGDDLRVDGCGVGRRNLEGRADIAADDIDDRAGCRCPPMSSRRRWSSASPPRCRQRRRCRRWFRRNRHRSGPR